MVHHEVVRDQNANSRSRNAGINAPLASFPGKPAKRTSVKSEVSACIISLKIDIHKLKKVNILPLRNFP